MGSFFAVRDYVGVHEHEMVQKPRPKSCRELNPGQIVSRIQQAEPLLLHLKPVLLLSDWPCATVESLGKFAEIETKQVFVERFHKAGLAPMMIAGDVDSVVRMVPEMCQKAGPLAPKAWAVQCLDPSNSDETMVLMVTLLHRAV